MPGAKKSARNEAMVAAVLAGQSFSFVGEIFGVTASRVKQVVKFLHPSLDLKTVNRSGPMPDIPSHFHSSKYWINASQESNWRHGSAGSPEYACWRDMRRRCSDPGTECYTHYGARGIRVCDRWETSFSAFISDVGPRPGRGYSIDRIDNNGNYEPGNCRWATRTVQARNTRRNRHIKWGGREQTIIEWAEELNISASTLSGRLRRGQSVSDALTSRKGRIS